MGGHEGFEGCEVEGRRGRGLIREVSVELRGEEEES